MKPRIKTIKTNNIFFIVVKFKIIYNKDNIKKLKLNNKINIIENETEKQPSLRIIHQNNNNDFTNSKINTNTSDNLTIHNNNNENDSNSNNNNNINNKNKNNK